MIKSQIAEVVGATMLDSLIASVEETTPAPADMSLKEALRKVRSTLIPPNVGKLTLAEKIAVIDDNIMANESPLDYARVMFTQDFLNNDLPYDFKEGVCRLLWKRFGERGNPIWKRYLDGKFVYINVQEIEA